MTTQTLPTQSKSEMLTLRKIRVPSDFSPASENARRTRGLGGFRTRRRTIGARVITSRSFSSKAMAEDAAREERVMETTVESMATRVALHPFLAGMNRKQLALLTACAVAVQFKKGQVIFREG